MPTSDILFDSANTSTKQILHYNVVCLVKVLEIATAFQDITFIVKQSPPFTSAIGARSLCSIRYRQKKDPAGIPNI